MHVALGKYRRHYCTVQLSFWLILQSFLDSTRVEGWSCFGKKLNVFVLPQIKILPSISLRHWKSSVLCFPSQLGTGKHLYHCCLHSLSCTFQEIKSGFCLHEYLRKLFCRLFSSVVICCSLTLLQDNTGENPSSDHPLFLLGYLFLLQWLGFDLLSILNAAAAFFSFAW